MVRDVLRLFTPLEGNVRTLTRGVKGILFTGEAAIFIRYLQRGVYAKVRVLAGGIRVYSIKSRLRCNPATLTPYKEQLSLKEMRSQEQIRQALDQFGNFLEKSL